MLAIRQRYNDQRIEPQIRHTVLELPSSTQPGRLGKASFCEPSPFWTMLQDSKSADSATWICTLPPIVRVAKAYQRLLTPMIAGSGRVRLELAKTVSCTFSQIIPGKLAPPIFGPAGALLERYFRAMTATSFAFTTGREKTGWARARRPAQKRVGASILMGWNERREREVIANSDRRPPR